MSLACGVQDGSATVALPPAAITRSLGNGNTLSQTSGLVSCSDGRIDAELKLCIVLKAHTVACNSLRRTGSLLVFLTVIEIVVGCATLSTPVEMAIFPLVQKFPPHPGP